MSDNEQSPDRWATHEHVEKPIKVRELHRATWEPTLQACVVYRELPGGKVWVRPDFDERYKPLQAPKVSLETAEAEWLNLLDVAREERGDRPLSFLQRAKRDRDHLLALLVEAQAKQG